MSDYNSAMTFATGQMPGANGVATSSGTRGSLQGIAGQTINMGANSFNAQAVIKWGSAPPPTAVPAVRGGLIAGIVASLGFNLQDFHAGLSQIRQGGDQKVAEGAHHAAEELKHAAAQLGHQLASNGISFGGSNFVGGGLGRPGLGGIIADHIQIGGIEI